MANVQQREGLITGEALLEMGDHPAGRKALHLGLVRRFVPADDGSYADIRAMVEACERAGFMEIR